MKILKNISPYKYLILIVLNIFVQNIFILIISIIYLYFDNKDNILIFLLIVCIICSSNNNKKDYIRFGIVDEKRNNYFVVNEGLYYSKIYSDSLNLGDVIYLNGISEVLDNDDLKYNYRFSYSDEYTKIFNIKIKKIVNNRLNSFPSDVSLYLKKFIYNDNTDYSLINVGYGFSFYIILVYIKRKHPFLSIILLTLFSILFKFDIKFFLIIIDVIFKSYNRQDRFYLKVLSILLLNYKLLLNFSILISLLFNLFFMLGIRNDKSYLMITESFLFYVVEPINIFLYKYLIIIRISIFVFSVLTLIFTSFTNLYLMIINVYLKFIDFISIEIRGELSILLLLFFLIYKMSKYNNSFVSYILLLLMLLSPINSPLSYVSFIDVGQGDAILIHADKNILIDTGPAYNYSKLKKALFKEGIYDVDYLIITHNDDDHNGNIDNLKKDFKIKHLITRGIDINTDELFLKYLYLGKFNNDNDNSLVYYLDYNKFKYLFTGDITSEVENYVFNKYNIRNIDVLKVSHHGSKYSTSKYFLSNLLPKISIISTSGMYNHPSEEVINNLNDFKVNTYVTKDDGTVKIINFFDYKILQTSNYHFVIIKS